MPVPVRRPITLSLAALAAASAACAQGGDPVEQGAPNVPSFEPAFAEQTRAPAQDSGVTLATETVADGLEHPWGIAVLPGGELLVTERPGRMRIVGTDGTLGEPVAGVPEVHAVDQGGLLDVALGHDFAEDRMVYWTYAKPLGDGMSVTAAARGRLSDDLTELSEVEDIFVQDPPSPTSLHYGARILFDDAGRAFVTTGDHFTEEERQRAQELDNTYGKVVRINADGSVPQDNPFVGQGRAVESIWSLGHRNIQGAVVHPETGQLWIAEHGPQGGDELNDPQPGANYGWPFISYGQNYDGTPVGDAITAAEGMEQPRYYWDPVIAPGGMLFYEGAMFPEWQGDLLIGSLTPGGIVRLALDGGIVTGEERLSGDAGRIRDLAEAEDGALLALVDAADGAVLRLTPEDAD